MSQETLNVTGRTTSEDNLIANYERIKSSELLLQFIDESEFEFFHDEKQDTFCRYKSVKSNVYEIRRLDEKAFKIYLSYIYRKKYGKTISDNSLKETITEISGKALHDGKLQNVFLRVAEHENKIYIDLCDDKWRIIEISDKWKILDSAKDMPVYFERNSVMKSLPEPKNHGDISKLWELINVPEAERILILTFILECYRISTQFPILLLIGGQGTGKSTTQEVIRELIDPSICNLRTAPKKPDDLIVEAAKNYLLSYNNMSFLSDVMHDDFCCISTGGGFSTRKFHTNTDQVICNICRPSMLNGISNIARRGDFLQRAIIIELKEMKDRISDSELKQKIKDSLPFIFGGLLDLMVNVLQILPEQSFSDKPPRMVDFALLGIAVEKAHKFQKGSFLTAYEDNQSSAQVSSLEASPIMMTLIEYIEKTNDKFFRGTPSDLLQKLSDFKFRNAQPPKNIPWPETAKAMGDTLNRYIVPLNSFGISVIDELKEGGKRNKKGKIYRIEFKANNHIIQDENTSTRSTSPALNDKKNNNDTGSQTSHKGVHCGALQNSEAHQAHSVRNNSAHANQTTLNMHPNVHSFPNLESLSEQGLQDKSVFDALCAPQKRPQHIEADLDEVLV